MTARGRNRWPLALAAWIIGPALWALSTQAGQVLPYLDCGTHSRWSLSLPVLGAALSLASAALAWRACAGGRATLRRGDTAFTLVASLGAMLGLLLALAMFLQAIGPMVLSGCES